MADPTTKRALEGYLVAAARTGDRRAVADLVALRGPRLFVHAVRLLGNRDEAEDAVQDAWVEILRGLGRLREIDAFPAWATRIVTRRCAALIKAKQRTRAVRAAVALDPPDSVPEAGPDAAMATALYRAIDALPREQAAAVALFYLDDMRVAEIAIALDIPPGTVKTRLMHARAKLKTLLEGDD